MSTQRYPNKKCEFCNAEFIPRNEKQRFCKVNHPMTCVICKKDCVRQPKPGQFEYSCNENECRVALRKKTMRKKYGVDSPLQSEKIQEKVKETNLKKYGVENPMQSREVQEKGKQTNLKRYGVENALQSKEVQEKMKETNLKKYGVENASSSNVIREKVKQTNLKKYGVSSPLQSKAIQEKIKETNMKRYGAEYALQSKEIQNKMKQTNLKRYGVENSAQSEQSKEKLRQHLIENSKPSCTDDEFIEVLESWRSIQGRKPTLAELQNYWGYANSTNVSQRISRLELCHLVNKKDSFLELRIKDFLDEFGINYKRRDKTKIKPLELDFYLPDYNVAIEVNDFLTHNSTFAPWGEPKVKDYHINKTKLCRDKEIRLIHAWEDQILDEAKFKVLKNAILHACGKSLNKVYARNTRVEMRPAIEMKDFFNENNIAGYRGAKEVYVLVCNKTNEDLMAYSVGHARFGKGKYDAEIIRGACKLGYTVVGGASKLWKHIINNTDYNSIVYYVDLNTYAGESMNFLENVEFVSEQPGLKNYWLKEKKLKNREPARHKEIVELTKQGEVWAIWDAGVQVNVWHRK